MLLNSFLVIDFDSTFVKLETLEEISAESLKNNPQKDKIQRKIEEITKKGMRGEISFYKSLQDRLALFSANKTEIEKVILKLKKNISKSFLENKEFFKKNGKNIFIVSGGFKECIFPISDDFGIPRENILANEFIFDDKNQIIGINKNNFLSKTQGKVKQIEDLKLAGKVFVVGDGWTDFEIKREGQADYFLAYTENVFRQNVVELADKEVKGFGEVIEFVDNH